MKKLSHQKGFTLVELAIVMTIIGLLIGGILKGQELMQNARVTSTIAQVKAFEAATTSFRDAYNAIPGDMLNANNRLPNCSAALCNPLAASAGDNIVGAAPTAGATTWGAPAMLPSGGASGAAHESSLYWAHLLRAGLIGGIANYAAGTTAAFGTTHPSANIGGGYYAVSGTGVLPPNSGTGTAGPNGLMLVITATPANAAAAAATASMQPKYAAQIDRKMDEGGPASGTVFAISPSATAAAGGATACATNTTPPLYNESVSATNCGLVFQIQG